MDTLVDLPWSTESFLAWEDQQEGNHEFDGCQAVPMTGGSVAHQEIIFNLRTVLARLLAGTSLRALHEMRLRIGTRVRYPGVIVFSGSLSQTVKTLDDAVVIFEVLSEDTAATDRVEKLIDYGHVPSLQYCIMLKQTSRAAVVCERGAGGSWMTMAQTEGAIALTELSLLLRLDDIYQGSSFLMRSDDRSAA